jgi:hypothetical protein
MAINYINYLNDKIKIDKEYCIKTVENLLKISLDIFKLHLFILCVEN